MVNNMVPNFRASPNFRWGLVLAYVEVSSFAFPAILSFPNKDTIHYITCLIWSLCLTEIYSSKYFTKYACSCNSPVFKWIQDTQSVDLCDDCLRKSHSLRYLDSSPCPAAVVFLRSLSSHSLVVNTRLSRSDTESRSYKYCRKFYRKVFIHGDAHPGVERKFDCRVSIRLHTSWVYLNKASWLSPVGAACPI